MSAQKKNPGRCGNSAGNESTTLEKEEITMKATTPTPECATVYLDPPADGPTIAEEDWASHHLADLPIVINVRDDFSVGFLACDDGVTRRRAGTIVLVPGQEFRINLFRGAHAGDLTFLSRIVERARRGYFARHGWREIAANDGTPRYRYSWYLEPRRNEDDFELIQSCPFAECVHRFHEGDPDYWIHERETINGDGYALTVERIGAAGDWIIDMTIHSEEMHPAKVGGFISDLRWATAECEKLNAILTAAAA